MSKHDLKVDWATHAAAKYACENWHYSGCLPVGKLVKAGVWEHSKFIGVVLFSRGASPFLGSKYNLPQNNICELARVAMTDHSTPVSRIMSIAIKFLRRQNQGIRLIVSFADQSQGHHGGIYQAGGWVYTGCSDESNFYMIHGKKTHPRTLGSLGKEQSIRGAKQIDPNATIIRDLGKHRYLMPLDDDMRAQILPLAKPYPKRAESADSGTSDLQSEGGGANPTSALSIQGCNA